MACDHEADKDLIVEAGTGCAPEATKMIELTEEGSQLSKPTPRSELGGLIVLARQVADGLPELDDWPMRIALTDGLNFWPDEGAEVDNQDLCPDEGIEVDELNNWPDEGDPANTVAKDKTVEDVLETSCWPTLIPPTNY